MSGFTNKGLYLLLATLFEGATAPTAFYLALVTSATTPSADANTLGDLTEITAGNGYVAGGKALTKGTTDFSVTEDDTNDLAQVGIKDIVFQASGGAIPPSGDAARYAVLTDANSTVANRKVLMWLNLRADRTITVGETFGLDKFFATLSVDNT